MPPFTPPESRPRLRWPWKPARRRESRVRRHAARVALRKATLALKGGAA